MPSECIISLFIILITFYLATDKFCQDGKDESNAVEYSGNTPFLFTIPEKRVILSLMPLKIWLAFGVICSYVLFLCGSLCLELKVGITLKECNDCACSENWKHSQDSQSVLI